jgi:hypothetical protein
MTLVCYEILLLVVAVVLLNSFLGVLAQCQDTEVSIRYVKESRSPEFVRHLWGHLTS